MFNDNKVIFEFRGPFGVTVQIGSSIAILGLFFLFAGANLNGIIHTAIFLGLIIGSIFLHELGHAWGCLVQGVPVRRIMIYGGGGFCEPSRSTTRSEDELIVAMGPIVNLAIWAIASLATENLGYGVLTYYVYLLAQINLFLALFNLLPVQPLDGGRLLQLGLARVTSAAMATKIAGGIGLIIAVLWIPMMILCYMTFGLVLFFIPSIKLHWQMFKRFS